MRKLSAGSVAATTITDRSTIVHILNVIKSIQQSEGHFNCYGTIVNVPCGHSTCLWKTDCLNTSKKKIVS
ncbi:MAG: hypothetical protein HZA18_05055 [Nitrospirae bacterium]|nr:hypothetical protein [Nitrospirota bacterium]MBI5407047.1 hypothetical protein [Nitrospirota bacterium]